MAKAIDGLFFLTIFAAVRGMSGHITFHEDTCLLEECSTPLAASLMQSASIRSRSSSGRRGDYHPAEADGKTPAGHELGQSLVSLGALTDLRKSNYSVGHLATVSSLERAPAMFNTTWLSNINKDSSGPLILVIVVLLLALIGLAVCMWQHPAVKGRFGNPAAEAFLTEPSDRTTMAGRQPAGYVRTPLMSARAPVSGNLMSGRGAPALLTQKVGGGRHSPPCRSLVDEGPTPEDIDEPSVSRMNTVDSQFCPDLIVPQHHECILCMPSESDRSNSMFEITDANGQSVLRVVCQPATAGRLWRATVTTTTGELLAQCCEARSQGGSGQSPEFQFMRNGGQLWARLVHNPGQDRYLLTLLVGGTNLHIFGNFENQAINITDDQNRLYANTEVAPAESGSGRQYCRVRVAPLADVGLALCGFLCVRQHMASQRRWGY